MNDLKFPQKSKKSLLRQKLDKLTSQQKKDFFKLSIPEKLKLLDAIKLN